MLKSFASCVVRSEGPVAFQRKLRTQFYDQRDLGKRSSLILTMSFTISLRDSEIGYVNIYDGVKRYIYFLHSYNLLQISFRHEIVAVISNNVIMVELFLR